MANPRFQVSNYDQKFLLELGPRTEYILIQGDTSCGVQGYTYTQETPSSVWIIRHNLNRYPLVALVDEDGYSFEATIQHISTDHLTVSLSKPIAGTANLV